MRLPRLRLTLRRLIVAMGVMAYGVTALPAECRAGDADEDKAIAAIEAIGGRVERVEKGGPAGCVHLHDSQGSDAGLAHIAGLKSLKGLYLDSTQVTDAGLAHIAGLTELDGLNLEESKVTDAGIGQFQESHPKVLVAH